MKKTLTLKKFSCGSVTLGACKIALIYKNGAYEVTRSQGTSFQVFASYIDLIKAENAFKFCCKINLDIFGELK